MTSSHLKNSSASLSQTVLHSSYNCKYFSAENVTNFSSLFADLRCSQSSVLSGKSSPKSSPSTLEVSGQKFCFVNFLDFIKLFWAQQRTLVLFFSRSFSSGLSTLPRHRLAAWCTLGCLRGTGSFSPLTGISEFFICLSSCSSSRSCSNFHFTRHVQNFHL